MLGGVNQDPKDSKTPPLYVSGTQVLIKVWKDGSPKAQLQPTWKGLYPVILSTRIVVKFLGHDSWIHYSWVKPWKKTEEDIQYTCEPLGDLRYLFRTTNECHSNEHPQIKLQGIRYLSSVQFSRSVMSDSLRPHGLQHTSHPYPSPTPTVYSNSCPLSRWCHPAISSSLIPLSSCPQSFPASGSFQISQLFASGGQSIGVSASASVLSMNIQN